jgi:hypothetical protein
MHFRWMLKGSVSVTLLLSAVLVARSDAVPVLDLQPICRGIAQEASDAGERGSPDVSVARWMRSELALKGKLAKKWSKYALADRQNCRRIDNGRVSELYESSWLSPISDGSTQVV